MRGMDVADLEACPLSRESPGPQCAQSPLMRDLAQRVCLVHELRQLAACEEILYGRCYRFRVHKVVGHKRFHFRKCKPFLDRPLHSHEAHSELVLEEFPNRSYPPVAEVVNIVTGTPGVFQLHEMLHDLDNVFSPEYSDIEGYCYADPVVYLQPSHL